MNDVHLELGQVVWRLGATIFFVFLNGFFVAAEFALVKVRTTRIRSLAQQGQKRAKLVEHLLDNLDLYLSGCQLGITVASLILGWLAEPAIADLLLAGAAALGLELGDGALLHGIALAIALTIVTILHMTLGEQAPKIWAIHHAETASLRAALPLQIFTVVLRPLIWLINALSNAILRSLKIQTDFGHEGSLNTEELREVLGASALAGTITVRQREFAENIIGFIDLEVRHVLVPRVEVEFLSVGRPLAESLDQIRATAHTRLPLCADDLDNVLGVIHAKDVLRAMLGEGVDDLEAIAREVPFVPDSQPLGQLIVTLQRHHTECAVVLDEHGTALGLAFLEDALEEIVGPIQDEFDSEDLLAEGIREVSAEVFEVRGDVSLPEAAAALGLEPSDEHDTISGLVIAELGRLPKEGDTLELGPYKVTVTELSRRRVVGLRFERAPVDSEEPASE